jgi:hypothetical protein
LSEIYIYFCLGSGTYPVEECPYEEVPTSTNMMTTTIDIAITSNNVEMSTAEMEITTDKSTDSEMTTININTDVPTVIDTTTITTKTSTTTSTTSVISHTTSKVKTSTTPMEITEIESTDSFETFTSTTGTSTITSRTTISTTTTTNRTDVELPETTSIGDSPNHSSRVGIVVGTLTGAFVVILVISLYVNRRKLYTRFSSKSGSSIRLIPVYSNSESSGGIVHLNNGTEQAPFADVLYLNNVTEQSSVA